MVLALGGLYLLRNAGLVWFGHEVWGAVFLFGAVVAAASGLGPYRSAGQHFTPAAAAAASSAVGLAFFAAMLLLDLDWSLLSPLMLLIGGSGAIARSSARQS